MAIEQEASSAASVAGTPDLVIAMAAGIFGGPDEVAKYFPDVQLLSVDLSDTEYLAERTAGAGVVIVTLQPLRAQHINALSPSVRVIGRAGVGLDTIDLEAARSAGITVINQPSYGSLEVASHAVAMLLAVQRRICRLDAYVRSGWQGPLSLAPMKPVDELVVGLVGVGRIGRATAEMLVGLVGRVVAYDPAGPAVPVGAEMVEDLDSLLEVADVVSLHMPLSAESQRMVDASFLGRMKPGSIFINVSRGGLVDEEALAAALVSGQLAGAALDVFDTEPLPSSNPLLSAPNALFSPHCAAYSERSSWRLMSWTLEDSISWARGGEVLHGNVVVMGER